MRSPHARFDGSLNCQPGADYGLGTLAGLEIKQETSEVRRTLNTENLGSPFRNLRVMQTGIK